MIVVASAMASAAALLAAATFGLAAGGLVRGLGRGGSFRASTKDATFELAEFPLEALDRFRLLGFAEDGPPMLCLPIAGLLTQSDELKLQAANDHEGAKEEPEKLAEALPEPGQPIRLRIVAAIRVHHERQRNRNERSLFRGSRDGHQGVKAVAIHAPQW